MQDNTLSYTANCLVVLLLYCYLFTANWSLFISRCKVYDCNGNSKGEL
jgi:hypothetical protein